MSNKTQADALATIRAIFEDAGITGGLHAVNAQSGATMSFHASTPFAMASLYKLPLLVAFARQVDRGDLDPREPVTSTADARTSGSPGLALMRDPVTMSLRDLAMSMISVSDNAAADILLRRVGLPEINTVIRDCGATDTQVLGGTATVHQTLLAQTRRPTVHAALAALADNDSLIGESAYDATILGPTTAQDQTAILTALWRGQLLPPGQTQTVREILGSQAWTHRIRSGFPAQSVRVSGKTGSLGALRHESAVVEFPHEPAYAVSVLTQAARADTILPAADRAIGLAARAAVAALRTLAH